MKISKPKIDPDTPRNISFDDPAVVAEFEERLVMGEPPHSICSDPMMPSRRALYMEMHRRTPAGQILRAAREAGQQATIDWTLEIADKSNISNWKVSDLKIRVRQWRATKISPKEFGELVAINAKGQQSSVTKVVIVNDPERDDSSADDDSRNDKETDL